MAVNAGHKHQLVAPLNELKKKLKVAATEVSGYRNFLEEGRQALLDAFIQGKSITALLRARAKLIDQVLQYSWKEQQLASSLSLIAVGGYGRGELHPFSDIDILIIEPNELKPEQQQRLEAWLAFLWDIGLEVGHSVRTVEQCIELADSDISVATGLMESRQLAGSPDAYRAMMRATGVDQMWHSSIFFQAKLQEQRERHKKFKDTSYNLEPNVKSNPGGLRDIQVIAWIAKRHFGAKSVHELTRAGVFTPKEYQTLLRCQRDLWQIRFALHEIAGRNEERLLFEHQAKVAQMLGYKDTKQALAVEQMMKRFYRSAMKIRNLNQLFIGFFQENLLSAEPQPDVALDANFSRRGKLIKANDDSLFAKRPEAFLELFIHMARHPSIRKISATTIRAMRQDQNQLNKAFREKPLHRQLFLEFLQIDHQSIHAFRLIKRHNVLGGFLPAFARIEGQMQFDLFHAYTVDEHTLFLLQNLIRFKQKEHADEYPICSNIMTSLKHPELIYLAAIFHDIAKGRGGDHSELGCQDAREFCQWLGLPENQIKQVAWLVQYHLVMSLTAQRRDISDPQVIINFAEQVGSQENLDLLYILTVADIRATNPTLWNSWKDALLKELYLATSRELDARSDQSELDNLAAKVRIDSEELLRAINVDQEAARAIWNELGEEYFLRYHAEQVAWHTQLLLEHQDRSSPLVKSKPHRFDAGTEILIASPDRPQLFAAITSSLSQSRLSVQAATLFTGANDYCLDTFIVLEGNGDELESESRVEEISAALRDSLEDIQSRDFTVARRSPERLQHFSVDTSVRFTQDQLSGRTIIEVTALDSPGLLAQMGKAFMLCGVVIHSAKIVTLGERVEDTFVVTDQNDKPIVDPQEQKHLADTLTQLITG